MSILARMNDELKIAMKAKDKLRINTLRLLLAQLKNAVIDSGEELSPEQEIAVLISAAKKRNESIQAFETADRQDLLEQERQELEIINEYLPEQLTDEEIEKEIVAVIQETGASGMKDLGKVMSEAMKRLKGKADGKKVQTIVRTKLA